MGEFEKENRAILKRHFALQEQSFRAGFKTKEVISMLLDEGKVDEDFVFSDKYIICNVNWKEKIVKLWEAKKFKK